MDAPVAAAIILGIAGMATSVVSTTAAARAQHRLSWYSERRPHYIALVESAAGMQMIQSRLSELLRSRATARVFVEQRKIRAEVNESARGVRSALFAVQLVATPPVFEAADRMLTVMAAGGAVLGRVSDDKGTWSESADQLDRLEEELFDARDDFIARARRELGLKPLSERISSSAAVEEMIAALTAGEDPGQNIP